MRFKHDEGICEVCGNGPTIIMAIKDVMACVDCVRDINKERNTFASRAAMSNTDLTVGKTSAGKHTRSS